MGHKISREQNKKKEETETLQKEVLSGNKTAQDIGVSAEGVMWIVGATEEGSEGNVCRWNEAKRECDPSIGQGLRITVTSGGDPWITNANHDVLAYTGKWTKVGGLAADIGASLNGYVTVIGIGDTARNSLWRNVDGPVEKWSHLLGQTAKSVAGDPQGNPWIIGYGDGLIYRWTGNAWENVPGAKGTDIGIGADGTVWIASDEPGPSGGCEVAVWDPSQRKWKYIPKVGAVRVSVYPNGDLAGIDKKGRLFRLSKPKSDKKVAIFKVNQEEEKHKKTKLLQKEVISGKGTAQDIGVSAEGVMWIISATKSGSEGNVCKWNEAQRKWDASIGKGTRITVTPQGAPWITNNKEHVLAYTGKKWSQVGVRSTDIGASANGYVTVVGDSAAHTLWRNVDGPVEVWWPLWGRTAKSVAGDPQGNPWIIGYDDGLIYRWTGNAWENVPGAKGTDIGIGADGTVWIVSDKPAEKGGYQVVVWNPLKNIWKYFPEVGAIRVAVYPNGDLAAVHKKGKVFKLSKPTFEKEAI